MVDLMDEADHFDKLAVYSGDGVAYVDDSGMWEPTAVVGSVAAPDDAWSGTGQANISLRNEGLTGLRFRASQAGSLRRVSVHVKAQTFQEIASGNPNQPPSAYSDEDNYGYGDGGNIRVRVYTESGSGPNFINEVARSENTTAIRNIIFTKNEVLNFELYKPLPGDPFGVDKSKRLVMTAGAKYHIIFENDASDPINNWASINWGHNVSGPRSLNPSEAWSPYWSDERVYYFRTNPQPTTYVESKDHQPAFQIMYIPTGTSTETYWGPINLLSSIAPKTATNPIGGMVPINGSIRLRQKFRVENEITVRSTLVAASFFNPASPNTPAGILGVTLQDTDAAELARADYGVSDSLNMNSNQYVNFWDNEVADGVYRYVGKALKNAGGTATPVTLVPGTNYYLCFERVAGNVTFMINIGQEPYKPAPGGYWTDGNYTPEGWATAATVGDCQAQWSTDGLDWDTCTLYTANSPDPGLEVRARLVT